MTPNSTKSTQEIFDNLIIQHPSLHAIVLSDRDGVVVLKSTSKSLYPEWVSLSSSFTSTCDSLKRAGLGDVLQIIFDTDKYQVMQFNHSPFISFLVADKDFNLGIMQDIGIHLEKIATTLSDALMSR